jgi:hypothetical protein
MNGADESRLAALATKVEELSKACERLIEENAELHRMVAAQSESPLTPRSTDVAPAIDARMDRRALGKLLGATAAGVVGATAVGALRASPAAAANGSAVAAGAETTAEARTSVRYDGSSGFGGVVLLGNDSTYSGTSAEYPAALGGWAGAGATAGKGGVANGIYGFTDNGNGNGVVGVNTGLVAGSGSAVLGLAAGAKNKAVEAFNSSGTAISGTSDSVASNATAIIGTISSTSPGGFSAALRGVNNGTGGLGIGVWGSQAGSGWGMYATSVGGIGVNAASQAGTGVAASGATGVSASGTDIGVEASGPTAVEANGGDVGIAASGQTAVSAQGQGTSGVAVTAQAHSSASTIEASNTGGGQAVTATAVGGLAAVHAVNSGVGAALHAEAKSGTQAAVRANNLGTGSALSARAGGGQPAIQAFNSEKGTALSAASAKGRGALFTGSVAQIRLTPAARATHPTSGERGDLFVDKSGRLWFCKAGGSHAKWVQIA